MFPSLPVIPYASRCLHSRRKRSRCVLGEQGARSAREAGASAQSTAGHGSDFYMRRWRSASAVTFSNTGTASRSDTSTATLTPSPTPSTTSSPTKTPSTTPSPTTTPTPTPSVTPTASALPCSAGYFPSLFGCAPCSPGTFAPANAAVCSLCPQGTYGSRAGLTSAACSGPCASCPAGSSAPPAATGGSGGGSSSPLTCVTADARALPPSLSLQLWPAAHPENAQRVDLVIAPLGQCQQMTSTATCAAAASLAGEDGTLRYVVGTAAAFHMEADATLTCA